MVHLTKAFIITTIVFAPALAAPLQVGQTDIRLLARDPSWFGSINKAIHSVNVGRIVNGVKSAVKRAAPIFNKVRGVVKKVAPIAAMVPGPIGVAGTIASAIARRDLAEALYTRALQGELDARGYDIQLDIRDVEGLEARDLSDVLEVRDNVFTLAAREYIDSIEMEARRELSDDLVARQPAELSFDELD
jgi:hypothetical protein